MPDVGSPMEILFLVLWRMRQQTEFHKSRVVVQALLAQQGVEGKHVEQAYKDLQEAYFPFEQTKKEEEITTMKKAMEKELGKGALAVKPMMDMTKDNMKQKLHQGQAMIEERASLLRSGRLQNLDKGDPFQKARNKSRGPGASLTKQGSATALAQRSQLNPLPIA